MDMFFEILKYTIPSALVIVVVWVMLNKFFAAESSRQRYMLYKQVQKDILPIRFTAYERLVLFLERITPDSDKCLRCPQIQDPPSSSGTETGWYTEALSQTSAGSYGADGLASSEDRSSAYAALLFGLSRYL